jgi:hypothetical protein
LAANRCFTWPTKDRSRLGIPIDNTTVEIEFDKGIRSGLNNALRSRFKNQQRPRSISLSRRLGVGDFHKSFSTGVRIPTRRDSDRTNSVFIHWIIGSLIHLSFFNE